MILNPGESQFIFYSMAKFKKEMLNLGSHHPINALMKFKLFVFIVVLLIHFKSHGQNPIVDSLKNELRGHLNGDTIQVILLNQLAFEQHFNQPIEAIRYSLEAVVIADRIGY